MREVLAVWAACAAVAAAILVTYSRFPPEDFYHVSGSGISGGAGRVLVFLNYPVAFVALAILPIAVARLLPTVTGRPRWLLGSVAFLSAGLCLVTAVSVKQADLDAKPINVLPALGVALIGMLTWIAIRRAGMGVSRPWRRTDAISAAIAGVLLVLGLPWTLAEVGVYAEDVPGLEAIFMSKEIEAGQQVIVVHLGEHHGFDGLLLALSALLLARVVGTLHPRWLDLALSWYLALMLVYGIANMFQDLWEEQVFQRGWVDERLPSVVRPEIRPAWGLIALAIIAVWQVLFHRPPAHRPPPKREFVPSP
jgi:hypothetical protein